MTTPVQNQTGAVVGGKCSHCGEYGYPYRRWCRMCGGEAEEATLSGAATLQAWTVIRIAPRDFTAPYVVGYALLREGPRVLVRVEADPGDLVPDAALTLSRFDPGPEGRPSVGLRAVLSKEDSSD